MLYQVDASTLQGSITVPTSKSHTMRAILFASLGKGESRIHRPLPSPDTAAMIAACQALGTQMTQQDDTLIIQGTAGNLSVPKQVIDVGNSGQVLRFIAAFAALLPQYTVITGDASICGIRPMNPLLDALTQAGAFAVSTKGDGHAPIIIRGPVNAMRVSLEGRDSQPVSAMLMLAAFLQGESHIHVNNPGELPWIDLTLYWLRRLGVEISHSNYTDYTVHGPVTYNGYDYTVPGDWSSAAFPIAAALTRNAAITLENMDYGDPQGDKGIIEVFRQMGAQIDVDDSAKRIIVHRHSGLHGIEVDVNTIIDAVPILATVACFANSPTTLTGASIARHKECDRLHAIACELGKMGAKIEEFPDGLKITPAVLHGAETDSWHDHRIAMSVAVAALSCGNTTINRVDCVAKSFPGFAKLMQGIGARITETV